jgi:hypothetical protein
MSIVLTSIYAARARRIRLVFSEPVAAGAFGTSLYTVASEGPIAASPSVRAAYAVAGQPASVELVLNIDLVVDASYTVAMVNIPAVAGGTPFSGMSRITYTTPQAATNVEPIVSDYDVILFGRDLVWNGNDFEEDVNGDLAVVSGIPNAVGALRRRFLGSPLPYAANYSPNAREYVDSNDATPLGSKLREQALRDPRVLSVKVSPTEDSDGNTVFEISPKFIGDRTAEPISVTLDT